MKLLKSSKLSDRFKNINNLKNSNDDVILFEEQIIDEKNNIADDKNLENDLEISLLNKIVTIPVWFEYTDLKQRELIGSFINNELNLKQLSISEDEKENLTAKLYGAISGFGQLDYFLSKDNVSAVFVTGTQNVYIEIDGKVLNTEISLSENQINLIQNNIFKSCKVKFDQSKKIWNLKNDKYYISIIMPPISESGINIIVRKLISCDIQSFFEKNITSKEIFDFIITSIAENKNIVLSGDINSGKTYFLNVLIKALKNLKLSVLIEQYPQIMYDKGDLIKFLIPDKGDQADLLLSNVLKISAKYIFLDLNKPMDVISENSGSILTLRAPAVDAALSKLISGYMSEQNLPEKYARLKVLKDFDYIVQLDKLSDGNLKVTSVIELKPARTLALSTKVIAKFIDGHYITEFPQPLTSISAEGMISSDGPMSSRFGYGN